MTEFEDFEKKMKSFLGAVDVAKSANSENADARTAAYDYAAQAASLSTPVNPWDLTQYTRDSWISQAISAGRDNLVALVNDKKAINGIFSGISKKKLADRVLDSTLPYEIKVEDTDSEEEKEKKKKHNAISRLHSTYQGIRDLLSNYAERKISYHDLFNTALPEIEKSVKRDLDKAKYKAFTQDTKNKTQRAVLATLATVESEQTLAAIAKLRDSAKIDFDKKFKTDVDKGAYGIGNLREQYKSTKTDEERLGVLAMVYQLTR